VTVREACIVAGGAGTRLRPLTATTPKPLLPFCGQPFLAGVLARLAEVGVERVLLVVGADPAPSPRSSPTPTGSGSAWKRSPSPNRSTPQVGSGPPSTG
jgi:dTDP-glucose pyrophosphorylase